MKDSKLLDSSIWIDYFFNGKHQNLIDSSQIILISSLSLFEIRKKLQKSKIENSKISKSMEFIKKRSLTVPVTDEIAEKAVDFSLQNDLPIIDALIYTTAVVNDAALLTLDNDFRGLKGATVLS